MHPENPVTKVFHSTLYYAKLAWLKYKSFSLLGKLLIWLAILFDIALLIVVAIVGPATVTQKFYDLGQALARLPGGWAILGVIMTTLSCPPLGFYWNTVSLCGFTYGFRRGFLLAGAVTVTGSAIVFIILRLLFRNTLRAWTSKNEKWQALEAVVKKKGLPLIILIRVSPFPPWWSYSNAFFASIEGVSLWHFVIANLFLMPKVVLVVFYGDRFAKFADGDQRNQMDTIAKVMNVVSIVVGISLGILAGVYAVNKFDLQRRILLTPEYSITFKLLQKQIQELHGSTDAEDALAAEALEAEEEGASLLQNLSTSESNL